MICKEMTQREVKESCVAFGMDGWFNLIVNGRD